MGNPENPIDCARRVELAGGLTDNPVKSILGDMLSGFHVTVDFGGLWEPE